MLSKKSVLFVLCLSLLLLACATTAAYLSVRYYILDAKDPTTTEAIVFDTELSKSIQGIARNLEQQGIIRSNISLRTLARLQSKDTQIKAGEYELSASMTPQQILDKMVRGEMLQRRATIKEGMTLKEIGAALEQAGIVDAQAFLTATRDQEILTQEGIAAQSCEGYLFPETYNFRRKTPARTIIQTMHQELNSRWQPEWTQRLQILGMTQHQLLTLASIVEKESGNFDEQPVIASVFHNRLRQKMRLQADPTVIYGIESFDGNITKRDLLTETPYNTYVIDGLPPGPIANPGLSAIKAALYPTDTNFLYFVGNGAGRHVFSENLYQHNEAVNRYQRGGARRAAQEDAASPPAGAAGAPPSEPSAVEAQTE